MESKLNKHIGTLGSPFTFAGQATVALQRHVPGLDGPTFLPTMDEVAAAVLDGGIDLGVLTSETSNTKCTDTAARILAGDKLYIAHEVVVPYRCALLGQPGADVDGLRHIGGHGSIRQCQEFLARRFPDATVAMHRQNSIVAAQEVLDGDGTSAVIGTEAAAEALGLEVLETVVDGGAVGAWWALSARLQAEDGGRVAAFRVEGASRLQSLLVDVDRAGLRLRSVTNQPTGAVFAYRYLVTVEAADRFVPPALLEAWEHELLGVFSSYIEDQT